jgi:Ser/Thr protein kinase RdoA (MazF antagonist)
LRRQLTLVEQTPMAFATLSLQSDHLLHGDYHDSNLFFNADEEVSHLFDWEKTEIAPREIELVRALLFTCFSNPENFRGTFEPHNFDLAAAFLSTYHALYPIEAEQFIAALHARYWGSLCSLWVVDEHYRRQNDRVDAFLEANLAEINYFAAYMPQLIDWFNSLWP